MNDFTVAVTQHKRKKKGKASRSKSKVVFLTTTFFSSGIMSDIKVHLLPFSVDREGPINTKEYFKAEKNQDQYETVMLGRKLVGTPVSLTNSTTLGIKLDRSLFFFD